jgi:hypothetical protein
MTERYRVCPHRNVPAAFEHFFVRKSLLARGLDFVGRALTGAGRFAHGLSVQPLRSSA